MNITGNPIEILTVFWAGVLVSFTPCVYPLLPITVSFIGGETSKTAKRAGFLISIAYVFGIALSYSALGIFAALSGKIFGQLQENPYLIVAVANIMIFFALTMFDIISLPTVGLNSQKQVKPRNIWAVIGFGMMSAIVVGPCLSPVLAGLLAFIASKQNLVYGIILMFIFSWGLGVSLILAGTFSGFLTNLPKSGIWMVRMKQLCGIILLIIAEYYLIKAGGLF